MIPALSISLGLQTVELQHGDQIFVRDTTPMSALIQNAEGDFRWSHICSIWFLEGDWWILTTGAYFDWKRLAFIFGRVPAKKYLAEREWVAQRRIDLTPAQQETRLQTLLRLEDRKTPYAVAKLIKLASWRLRAGVADKLHDPPEVWPVKTFCAESEALSIIEAKRDAYWGSGEYNFQAAHARALREVNDKYPQKLEACVHTPETLFDAAASVPVSSRYL